MNVTQKSLQEVKILASFERDEWQTVPDLNKEIARFASMAAASLAKDKRVNINSTIE